MDLGRERVKRNTFLLQIDIYANLIHDLKYLLHQKYVYPKQNNVINIEVAHKMISQRSAAHIL